MVFLFSCPHSRQRDLANHPCCPPSAWDRIEITSKYLLGCLSTLFISRTAGVISLPKFSGKFWLFISSQMFANLLNIQNVCNTPKQTCATANHRLLTERLTLTLMLPMQYDIILMSLCQRGTQRSLNNVSRCNKPYPADCLQIRAPLWVDFIKIAKPLIFTLSSSVIQLYRWRVYFVLFVCLFFIDVCPYSLCI